VDATDTGTIPVEEDSDGDGMADGWEAGVIQPFTGAGADGIVGTGDDIASYLDPTSAVTPEGGGDDPDGDGYSNIEEYGDRTDPTDGGSHWEDTDEDGISDAWELTWASDLGVLGDTGTNGVGSTSDYDGDGVSDYDEYVSTYDLDPTESDTDGDGAGDGEELSAGTDPTESDTDGDGYTDGWELEYEDEAGGGWDALVDDTGNGIYAPGEDADGDSLTNMEECQAGTNPLSVDTDGDGFTDDWELTNGYDPLDAGSRPKSKKGSGGGGCAAGQGGITVLFLIGIFIVFAANKKLDS